MVGRNFVKVKLVGARDLERALLALPKHLRGRTIKRALMRAAQPIADDAVSRAPIVRLKPRIEVADKLSKRQRSQVRRRKDLVTVYVGVRPSPLAHLFEFGTKPRHTKAGAFRGQMRPQPYMRPAWDAGKNKALDDFGRILGQEIEASARRLAKRQARAAKR